MDFHNTRKLNAEQAAALVFYGFGGGLLSVVAMVFIKPETTLGDILMVGVIFIGIAFALIYKNRKRRIK